MSIEIYHPVAIPESGITPEIMEKIMDYIKQLIEVLGKHGNSIPGDYYSKEVFALSEIYITWYKKYPALTNIKEAESAYSLANWCYEVHQ